MEPIKIEITKSQLQEAVEASIKSTLTSSYGNPVTKAVEQAIKDQDGPIQTLVKEIITETLTDPTFRAKMGEVVINLMVSAAMKK